MASPDAPSASDGTTSTGGVSPPADPISSEIGLVPEHSFTDNWRRIWRRLPDMGHAPADLGHAFTFGLVALILGAIVGTAIVLLAPSAPPTIVLLATLSPIGQPHLDGVRHRWWALGAGAAAGVPAGLAIHALFQPSIGAEWATLIGLLAGSWIGVMTHAAATHLPTRRMQRLLP